MEAESGTIEHRRVHRGKKTRERLLEAGMKLFAHYGFDGTTVGDLEKEAGLRAGTGSFYRHFRNKRDLFDKVVKHGIEQLKDSRKHYQGILSGTLGDTRADVLLNLRIKMMNLERIRTFIEILIREERRFPPEQIREFYEIFVAGPQQNSIEELQTLISSGKIVNVEPGPLAAVISCALIGNHLIKRYYGVQELNGVSDEKFTALLADLIVGPLPSNGE